MVNTIADNVGVQPLPVSVFRDPFHPILIHGRAQLGGHEVNAPPYGLSAILKKILSYRISHPDSEVVAFRTETIGNGKTRVTVSFETSGEM